MRGRPKAMARILNGGIRLGHARLPALGAYFTTAPFHFFMPPARL